MLPQSAPKGGDLERMDLEGGDVQGLQMRHPGRLVGEMMRPVIMMGGASQAGDERAGQLALAPVGQGRVIDRVIFLAGAQQLQEVAPALGKGRGERGEAVVADLG